VQPAETTAFVVAPQKLFGAGERARLRQFVQQGGMLVIASDTNRTNQLLSDLDVETRIDSRPLRDESENYRGPSLPVATNVQDANLTDGVKSLTLNYSNILSQMDE
jgi:hypothetical protein